jgi:hypothetical protein
MTEIIHDHTPRQGQTCVCCARRIFMPRSRIAIGGQVPNCDSPLEEGGFELVVPLCLGIDIVIGDSSLVPREFGLARQAYGAIAW